MNGAVDLRDVFVSKPSWVSEDQSTLWQQLKVLLEERDLRPRTVGITDYPNTAPISEVRKVMGACQGAVILGLVQIRVIEGVAKEGSEKEHALTEHLLPTAWNHLEAGMAFALELPVLVVKEQGVTGGVFELGATDRFIHEVSPPADEWLRSQAFRQPLNRWVEEVLKQEASKK